MIGSSNERREKIKHNPYGTTIIVAQAMLNVYTSDEERFVDDKMCIRLRKLNIKLKRIFRRIPHSNTLLRVKRILIMWKNSFKWQNIVGERVPILHPFGK